MDLTIKLAGGNRIEAAWDGINVVTEQDGSAPSPFELFLASLGTCAGFYIASFCGKRGLSTDGIAIVQHVEFDEHHVAQAITIDVTLPPGFPEQYRAAVLRSAGQCAVKKALEKPPRVEVRAV